MSALRARAITLAVSAAMTVPALTAGSPAVAAPRACAGWTVVSSPSLGSATLSAVAATSARDAWAVGSYSTGSAYKTLIEHWNGSSWTTVTSPGPGRGDDWLFGVTAVPGGGFWAVGTTGSATLAEFRC